MLTPYATIFLVRWYNMDGEERTRVKLPEPVRLRTRENDLDGGADDGDNEGIAVPVVVAL